MHNYPGFGIDLEYMQHKAWPFNWLRLGKIALANQTAAIIYFVDLHNILKAGFG